MHFVVFLCTFFLFFSCFSLYLLLNLFASIPAFLFYLLIFFQIFHSRLCCSIKVNRKDQVDIAFSIIFDEARCFRIHQINCYFFVVDMTVKRTSMTRIAGGYLDMDGYIDGTFNTGFLKLSPDEKEKNLQIAKVIPFADTNQNLKEYAFSSEKMKGDSMWKLLMGMRVCGLKNDALMETFYEIVGEQYQAMGDYAVYVFHDRYDIPAKGKDHVR